MRVNNKKGAMIGTLVARVEVLEALVAGKTPQFKFVPTELATSAKLVKPNGYKVRLVVKLTDGADNVIPYNGKVALKATPTSEQGGKVTVPETIEIKNGYGEFVAEYNNKFVATNSIAYTVGAEMTILAKPVTEGTLTDTIGE